ncbi:MAG: MFS transporter [bacterium]|nr:MFS transporter [bacterium]
MRMRTPPDSALSKLPAVHRLFPGVFYGWLIVFGSALVSFVCVGVGFYSQAVLLDSLVETRGFTRESISAASSLYFMVAGIAGSLIGLAIDRWGPRLWIISGSCLMAGGLAAIGRAQNLQMVYAFYVFMAIGFAMCTSVPNNAIITRWFVSLRTRAMSVSQTGVSVGGIVVVPMATWLILHNGLESATALLALVIVAVALPVTVFILRWDPAEFGLEPDGAFELAHSDPRVSMEVQRRIWTLAEAVSTAAFRRLAIAFGMMLFAQVGFLIHTLSYLRPILGANPAALALSTVAGGSIIGRLAVGFFADQFEKRRLAAVLFCVQGVAVLVLSFVTDWRAVYLACLFVGFTIGNIFMFQSLLASELFGIPSFGTVFGALQLCTQVISSLGPLALGWLSVQLGGYPAGLRVLAFLAFIAALIVSTVRPPLPLVVESQGRTV